MAYSDIVLADSPAAYWRLGESAGSTVADASGNGHTGSYVGSPTLSEPGALYGDSDTAVAFDGSTQYATITGWDTGSTAYSVEAWFKQDYADMADDVVIVGRTDWTTFNYGFPWGIYLDQGRLGFFTDQYNMQIGTTGSFSDGKWHHVVLTVDATNRTCYVDGVLRQSSASTGVTTSATVPVTIACDKDGAQKFTGTVDDVAVYTDVLTPTEVLEHYNAGRQGAYQHQVLSHGPMVWWSLDDASGTTVVDASGNARHGTYYNTPTLGQTGLLDNPDTGTSVSFAGGSSEYVRWDGNAVMNGPDITVEVWVKTTTTTQSGLFTRWDVASSSVRQWALTQQAAGHVTWSVRLSSVETTLTGTTNINDDAVHHVVGVRDSATGFVGLYVDGVLEDSAVVGGTFTTSTSDQGIHLAAFENGSGTSNHWTGTADEAAVYLVALDRYEVAENYYTGLDHVTARLGAATTDLVPVTMAFPMSHPIAPATVDLAAPAALRDSGYHQAVLSDSPLAYWRLSDQDSHMADWSGNNRHGVISGPQVTHSVAGVIAEDDNKAINFDYDAVTVSGATVEYGSWMDSASITVEAWVTIDATSTSGRLVCHAPNAVDNAYELWFSSSAFYFYWYTSTGDYITTASTGVTPTIGQTYHVVGRIDNTAKTSRLFVDGVDVSSVETTFTGTRRVLTSPHAITLGHRNYVSGQLQGTLDEVAIYGAALTDSVIVEHFVLGAYGSAIPLKPATVNLATPRTWGGSAYSARVAEDSPILWWRLGEASGATAACQGRLTNLTGTYENVSYGTTGAVGDADTGITMADSASTRRAYRTGFFIGADTSVGMEVWFKTTATSGTIAYVTNWLSLHVDSNGKVVASKRSSSDVVAATVTSTAALNDGEWHQVAVRYALTGYRLYLYVDGRQDVEGSIQYTGVGTASAVYVGQDKNSTDQFVGSVDEFSLWTNATGSASYPLDAADVPAHYQAAGYLLGEYLAPAAVTLGAPTQFFGAVVHLAPARVTLGAPAPSTAVRVTVPPIALTSTAIPPTFDSQTLAESTAPVQVGGSGATPGAVVRLYSSSDDALGDLTDYESLIVTQSRQPSTGSLVVTFPANSPAAQYVERDMLFARLVVGGTVESDVWVLDEDEDDEKDPAGDARPLTAIFPSIEAWFATALVYPEESQPGETGVDVGGNERVMGHRFADANPGQVMKVLIDKAQARTYGALKRITYDFDATYDSNGVAWTSADTFDETYTVGTDLLQVLKGLSGVGWCEYQFEGFMLHLYRNGTLGSDQNDVVLRVGRDVRQAPRRRKRLGARTTMLVHGKDGALYEEVDTAAVAALERREGFYSRNEVYHLSTMTALALNALEAQKRTQEELTLTLDPDACPFQPETDFATWDRIFYDKWRLDATSLEPLRVNTVTRRWDASGERLVEVEVLDLIADQADRLEKLLERLQQPDNPLPQLPDPIEPLPVIPWAGDDWWTDWEAAYGDYVSNFGGGGIGGGFGLVYVQPNEPLGVPVGTLWFDTDDFSV